MSTSTSPDTLARSLADHFAPELGAALPQFAERLLAGEPPDDASMRTGELRAALGYAGYLIRLSEIALEVHDRVALARAGQPVGSKTALLGDLLVALRAEAPQDPRVPDALRGRMVRTVADLTLGRPRLLPHAEIVTVHRAAVAAKIDERRALLAGIDRIFVGSLPVVASPAEQLLCDLDALNAEGALADGSVPLAIWLDNAVLLAGPKRDAAVFAAARGRLKVVERAADAG